MPRYFLTEDYTGGKQVCDEFNAPSVAAATTVAYVIASALQRSVRLVPIAGAPPYTLITGILPTNALTQIPSGVTSP